VKDLLPKDYASLLADIKQRIRSAQYEALKAVNKELVGLYWDIGKMIVERQAKDKHGDATVKQLAKDLQVEFKGVAGFSWRNLFNMREFYLTYCENPKLQPLVAIIGWSHNLAILQQCKDPLEREFYIKMTKKFGWSKNVLIHQVDNKKRMTVEYALREASKPIGVATYKVVKQLPTKLKNELPAPEQIQKLMEDV
jgi:predicted nuclease of restriction endonuclease-like (RecB) superfamily